MERISPPVRIFAVLLVLLGVAGMLAMRTMGPSAAERAALLAPLPQAAKRTQAAPQPVQGTPAEAAPKQVLNPVVPATGYPVAVDRALRKAKVVVVSLVVPGARVDELAAAEARAGAKLAGAGYVALNVLNERVGRSLLAKLGPDADYSVLVFARGEVALKLNGFVDRDTVAQAAANAAA